MNKAFTLLSAILLGCLLSACATHQSPTGRGQMLMFSAEDMRQMGEESFAQIKEQEKESKDPAINAYVRCISAAVTAPELLAAVDPAQVETWDVVVFESEQVNAFALPGGHIGVYTGLLDVAETPDQLATVIGHEVGHVMADHGNEQVSRGQLAGLGMQVADIALGGTGSPNKDVYMAALGLGVQVGVLMPYGRAQESEADVIGLELMARAGFEPAASVELWQNMAKASGGAAPPELLSTHPSHSTRIQTLQSLIPKGQELARQARAAGRVPKCRKP